MLISYLIKLSLAWISRLEVQFLIQVLSRSLACFEHQTGISKHPEEVRSNGRTILFFLVLRNIEMIGNLRNKA